MDRLGDVIQGAITMMPYLILAILGPMVVWHTVPPASEKIVDEIVAGMIGAASSGGAHQLTKLIASKMNPQA